MPDVAATLSLGFEGAIVECRGLGRSRNAGDFVSIRRPDLASSDCRSAVISKILALSKPAVDTKFSQLVDSQ